jgi:DNA-binding response OmpR family regulator
MSEQAILIIEDDPVIRLGMHVSLRAHQYKTYLADDAIVSIAEARKHLPDLIILDLGLPAGDGFVVMERLKQFPSLAVIPVIVVSGRDPRLAESKAIACGASAFLQKPVDNQVLLSVIRRLLPKQRAATTWFQESAGA